MRCRCGRGYPVVRAHPLGAPYYRNDCLDRQSDPVCSRVRSVKTHRVRVSGGSWPRGVIQSQDWVPGRMRIIQGLATQMRARGQLRLSLWVDTGFRVPSSKSRALQSPSTVFAICWPGDPMATSSRRCSRYRPVRRRMVISCWISGAIRGINAGSSRSSTCRCQEEITMKHISTGGLDVSRN